MRTQILARFARYLHRLALSFVIGQMLFFALIFAPRVFRVLERSDAAKLQLAIFPAYFMSGILCCLVLFTLRGYEFKLRQAQKLPPVWLPLILTLFALVLFELGYTYFTPAIAEQVRVALENGLPRSPSNLHKWSMWTNVAALFSLLFYLSLKEPELR